MTNKEAKIMSTRSLIWLEVSDGSYRGIYCHHDGYIKRGVGETLLKYYQDYDRIVRLINLGGLSSLGMYIDPLPDGVHMGYTLSFEEKYYFSSEHSFDNPQEDVCVAYHRDRNEELEILSEPNLDGVIKGAEHTWAEYIYIFRTNKWYVIDLSKGYDLKLLEDVWRKIRDNEKN